MLKQGVETKVYNDPYRIDGPHAAIRALATSQTRCFVLEICKPIKNQITAGTKSPVAKSLAASPSSNVSHSLNDASSTITSLANSASHATKNVAKAVISGVEHVSVMLGCSMTLNPANASLNVKKQN